VARTDVFINCPFDDDYQPLFEVLVFAIAASGYKVRCALEDNDGANIRFDKLRRLIAASPRSIHDLSRTGVGLDDRPRFNMPFELGLAMGAKYFGGPRRRKNSALIMVERDHVLSAYLSDLGGNDPEAHGAEPANVIRIVMRYLQRTPDRRLLPGAQFTIDMFARFKERLPDMATALRREPDEVHPFRDYGAYRVLVDEFLRESKRSISG